MKNFLLAFFMLFSSFGFGQDYLPIFEGYDSVRWNTPFIWSSFWDPVFGIYTKSSKIDSLVIEDRKEYRVLSFNSFGHEKKILVREDIDERKVYATVPGSFSESVVYDFGLEVGEWFFLDFYDGDRNGFMWGSCSVHLKSIEKKDTFGAVRNVFHLKSYDFNSSFCRTEITWIEGIGSTSGFEYFDYAIHKPDSDLPKDILCLFKNGKQIIGNDTCNLNYTVDLTASEDFSIDNNISIYPNPTDNQLFIKTGNPVLKSGKIKITDLAGQNLIEKEVQFRGEVVIEEVQKLASGIYILSVFTENGVVVNRFIKN